MIDSIKSIRFSPAEAIKHFIVPFSATLVAFIFLLTGFISTALLDVVSVVFLISGFVFPGMTHGSLDLYLLKRSTVRSTPSILIAYVATIFLIIATWYFCPLIIFMLFIVNSCYHFGETDLRFLSKGKGVVYFIYGFSVLTFLFSTHLNETEKYLSEFSIHLAKIDAAVLLLVKTICLMVFLSVLLFSPRKAYLLNSLMVLLIGSQLPLLLAFGIYYILIHSYTSWKDIHDGLGIAYPEMAKLAVPFTFSGLLIMVSAYFLFNAFSSFNGEPVALISVGVAAITLPHTVAMGLFYSRKSTPLQV
jgi:Brp/Blh family beta-carotene 15,15'-monooxygenase